MKIKKHPFFLAALLLAGTQLRTASAQVFHFQDTTTTLELTTNQTPAHWFLEIFNDVGVDTTLRWKSNFVNVPASWTVQLDVQTAIFLNIQSGDSADFILKDSMLFPQKLIIGAFTNNTPATASVFFDIYDPANPANKVTIEYLFIITPPLGMPGPGPASPVIFTPGTVFFSSGLPTPYSIYTSDGRLLVSGVSPPGPLDLPALPAGVYIFQWSSAHGVHRTKWIHHAD